MDTRHGFILGGHATAANRYDGKELMNVVNESDLEKGSPIYADKGYSSAANRCDLTDADYAGLIMYKATRGSPLSEAEWMVNQAISKVRGSVERSFDSMRKHYDLARARYLGTAKVKLQLMISAIAFNIKKAAPLVGG